MTTKVTKISVPVGVGNKLAQERFIQNHRQFLDEYLNLHKLLHKIFVRTLTPPSPQEFERINLLPEGDAERVAFDNKWVTDVQVFYLGRIAVEDFTEICILAGNGCGFGAYKTIRGMYERIVTAAYIAKHQTESRIFAENNVVQKWKLWQELVGTPEIKQEISEKVRDLEEQAKAVRAKQKEEICRRCGQPITQEAWTRKTLKEMAEKAGYELSALYASAYLAPTFHSHPTSYDLQTRLTTTESGGFTFKDVTEKEADGAVMTGHNLVLKLIQFQNEYFGLGLEQELKERLAAFCSIWDSLGTPLRSGTST